MSDFDLVPLHSVLEGIAHQGRSALLPALHAAQDIYGYLPQPVAAEIGRILGVPLADVYGVIDFYSMFYRDAVGKTVIQVCDDPACGLAVTGKLLTETRAGGKPSREGSSHGSPVSGLTAAWAGFASSATTLD